MSQKPNHKNNRAKQNSGSMNGASGILIFGCLAEMYLLLLRKFYINGTLEQVVAWDSYLTVILYASLAVLAVGLVLGLVFRKEKGWKGKTGWILFAAGVFLAASSWLVQKFVYTALTPLCIIVPVTMVLGILWRLYDQECAYALTILGATVLVLWTCRKGLGTMMWNGKTMAVAVVYLAVMAAAAVLFWKAGKAGGMLGKIRLLPAGADVMPVCVACGVSLVAVALALISSTVAYYAMWAVCIVIFALAVYYTVRQL